MKRTLLALAGAVSIACGSDLGDDAPTGGDLVPPDAENGFQIEHSVSVPAGGERVVCRRFVVPADRNVEVAGFEHRYGRGAHHVILYREPSADPTAVKDELPPRKKR